jgi:hypothetical protein
VPGLYPGWLRRGLAARLYTRLARRWPGLCARDFIVVARKLKPEEPALSLSKGSLRPFGFERVEDH